MKSYAKFCSESPDYKSYDKYQKALDDVHLDNHMKTAWDKTETANETGQPKDHKAACSAHEYVLRIMKKKNTPTYRKHQKQVGIHQKAATIG